MERVNKSRLVAVFLFFGLFFLGILIRLFWIQVVDTGFYKDKAYNQQRDRERIPAVRGIIYDRNGNVLALNESVVSIYCIPRLIEEPADVARELAKIIEVDSEDIAAKFDSDEKSEWLVRDVEPKIGERVLSLGYKGIFAEPTERRVYPEGTLGAHILGYVGIRDGSLAGAERSLDRYLEGLPGFEAGIEDAVGRHLPDLQDTYVAPFHGLSVELTIDKWCQYVAERELEYAVDKYSAKGGVVLIMDPGNGEILAMASAPTYNPNSYNTYPPDSWRNNAIINQYEPGSIAKIFIAAAALEEGVVDKSELFDITKKLIISNRTISDIHPLDKKVALEEIIARSSNIGISLVSKRLGGKREYRYLREFGFGEPTGITLPAESKGSLRKDVFKYPSSRAFAAFGQGWSATPLQVCVAGCALANDGWLVRPTLLKSIIDGKGEVVYTAETENVRKIVGTEAAKDVLGMMEAAVYYGGGVLAKVDGYRIAGKTGTSEVARTDGRGYNKGHYVSSFTGIAPADDPQVVILVVIFEPQGEHYGGKVAAPIFANIARDVLPALKIPPTGTKSICPERPSMPMLSASEITGYGLPGAIIAAGSSGGRVRLVGDGNKIKETEYYDEANGSSVMLTLSGKAGSMPDVTGLPVRDALRELAPNGLEVKVSGFGNIVIKQTPKPGADIRDECTLTLGWSKTKPKAPAEINNNEKEENDV